jgi:hypothetical protein
LAPQLNIGLFLGHRLKGGLIPHRLSYFDEAVPWGAATRTLFHDEAAVLIKVSDAERECAAQERARRQALEAEERRRKHEANMAALEQRRAIAFPVAFADAVTAAHAAGTSLWLGVPAERTLPGSAGPAELLYRARGNEKTASASVIWLGDAREQLRMFGAVCPVASRIGPGIAALWRQRGVYVYVADEMEARHVSRALGWPTDRLIVASDNGS